MSRTISAKIEGLQPLLAKLAKLDKKTARKAIRRAVTKGGRLLAKAVKGHVSRRTGTLKKSIGSKVKTYGKKVVAIVGPRTGMKVQIGTTKDGRPIYEDPANIAHLVELGHAGPHPAPAKPFMRPALDQTKGAIKAVFAAEINAALQQEASTK